MERDLADNLASSFATASLFSEILDALPVAIYTTDAEGKLTHFNQACVELSGRTPEIGKDRWCVTWRRLQPDGSTLPRDRYPMAVALRERRSMSGAEAIAERPDGSRIWFAAYPTPLLDSAGRLVGGINMLIDVTERKRAEAERALLAAVVENSDDAIITKDLDGFITSWNRGAQRLFGYHEQESVGRPVTILIPQSRQHEEPQILERLRRGERVDHFETVRVRKDGGLVNISLTISPIKDSAGRIIGISKIARDITDRKRAEAALRAADERKNIFLATLAHELRNPLAPIRNSVHILRRFGNQDRTLSPVLEMLDRQIHHMVRLVDDLMDVARITSGKMELQTERVEVAAIVRGAIEISQPHIDSGGHHLSVTLPAAPVTIEADAVRMTQVVANLLNNAAKYTEPGGQIWITVEVEESTAMIHVRDSGVGIAAEVLPHIFEMFTQADVSAHQPQSGLGIGLALARRLVEMHGGRIEAHSEGPGKGSEFVIQLPFEQAQVARETHEAQQPPNGPGPAGGRILIVDDNRDAANSLGILLGMLGNEVRTANDGMAALAILETYRPTVVLMDLGMPAMSGYEVARRARELPTCQGTVFVAITGWGQDNDRRLTREAGFNFHLVKPVNLDALEHLLADIHAPKQPQMPLA